MEPIGTHPDEAAQEAQYLDHQIFARNARLKHGPSFSHLDLYYVSQTHETKLLLRSLQSSRSQIIGSGQDAAMTYQ